jgi:hypothetical protein
MLFNVMISRFFPFFHQKTAGTGKRENREKKAGKRETGKRETATTLVKNGCRWMHTRDVSDFRFPAFFSPEFRFPISDLF